MRKAVLYLLFGSLVVVLAACGGSPAPRISPTAQSAPLSLYFSPLPANGILAGLYALNASDGLVRWSQNEVEDPVLKNGVIYAAQDGRSIGVAAFAASDGRRLWFYQSTGAAFITAVVNGVVYATIYALPSGHASMYALRASDGRVLWHADQPYVEHGDAVVDAIVYAFMAKDPRTGLFGEVAFNAQNGDVLWKYQPADGDPSFVQASNGQACMLIRSRDVGTQAYLAVLSASDGSVVWRYPQTGYADLQVLGEAQGLVYLNSQDDATLYALNASDGSIRWHVPKGAKSFSLRPLLANDTLYAGLPDGTVYALNTSDGTLKWQAHVGHAGMRPEDLATSPTATGDGAVYVSRSPDGLFALNASDGALQWVHAASPDVPVAVTAMNGVVYASTINAYANTSTVSAFKARDGSMRWSYQTGLVLIPPIVG